MTSVVEVTTKQLKARRQRLLRRSGMSWERLSELADAYMLDAAERNLYETIRSIDYLLADDTKQ